MVKDGRNPERLMEKLEERQTLATASDVARIRDEIRDGASIIVDALADQNPRVKENPKRMQSAVESLVKVIASELTYVFGFEYSVPKYEGKEPEEVLAERILRAAGIE